MARRHHISLMLVIGVMIFMGVTYLMSSSKPSDRNPMLMPDKSPSKPWSKGGGQTDITVPDRVLAGGAIAPKLENATAKAELGRASWKLLHTMMARFPEKPTDDDRLALETYMGLFARLYPCGECASHFQKLLKKYPPQTSSRNNAAGWACFVHNEVNKRLEKEEFNCEKIGDFYDCGCGDDKKKGEKGADKEEGGAAVSLEKEGGLMRGG